MDIWMSHKSYTNHHSPTTLESQSNSKEKKLYILALPHKQPNATVTSQARNFQIFVNYSATAADPYMINTRGADLCQHRRIENMSFQIEISIPSQEEESTKKHGFKAPPPKHPRNAAALPQIAI